MNNSEQLIETRCFSRVVVRRAKAACSIYESPSDWRSESDLPDFHVVRQDFSPMKRGFYSRNHRYIFAGSHDYSHVHSLAYIKFEANAHCNSHAYKHNNAYAGVYQHLTFCDVGLFEQRHSIVL